MTSVGDDCDGCWMAAAVVPVDGVDGVVNVGVVPVGFSGVEYVLPDPVVVSACGVLFSTRFADSGTLADVDGSAVVDCVVAGSRVVGA